MPLCKQCDQPIIDPNFLCTWSVKEGDKFGPYCGVDCMCYMKICSKCNKDFSVNHRGRIGIKFIDGEWICDLCNLPSN